MASVGLSAVRISVAVEVGLAAPEAASPPLSPTMTSAIWSTSICVSLSAAAASLSTSMSTSTRSRFDDSPVPPGVCIRGGISDAACGGGSVSAPALVLSCAGVLRGCGLRPSWPGASARVGTSIWAKMSAWLALPNSASRLGVQGALLPLLASALAKEARRLGVRFTNLIPRSRRCWDAASCMARPCTRMARRRSHPSMHCRSTPSPSPMPPLPSCWFALFGARASRARAIAPNARQALSRVAKFWVTRTLRTSSSHSQLHSGDGDCFD